MLLYSFNLSRSEALFHSALLSCSFVGSLYVFAQGKRNDPSVIKKRFLGVACCSVLSPLYVSYLGTSTAIADTEALHSAVTDSVVPHQAPLLAWFGLSLPGTLPSTVYPLGLTMIWFFGPLLMDYYDNVIPRSWTAFKEKMTLCLNDLRVWRDWIIAPIAEEWIYRACMFPLLVPSLGFTAYLLINPALFSFAHFHHLMQHRHLPWKKFKRKIFMAVLQWAFTSIFGIYSSFIYMQTGHIIAPVICHIFCNILGFPDFESVFTHYHSTKLKIAFVGGLLGFFALINPLTQQHLYSPAIVFQN